jgi:hypothetical protein
MKDEDIRKQIEDHSVIKIDEDDENGLCQVCISFNSRVSECTGSNLCIVRHLSIKLIEARKTIQSQRESLERFILGKKE